MKPTDYQLTWSEPLGQPTRRFTHEDLRDPRTLKYMRERMGRTQKDMAAAIGVGSIRQYQEWEKHGMRQVSDMLRRYVLLKFDLFLLAEKHSLA
tara:strand:+ start:563 stop:844 length:282 start_codon:yes stop_codon:yes gene_type:complete